MTNKAFYQKPTYLVKIILMKGGLKLDNLKALREEKGISQQKLAEKLNTNQQNIHNYEHGFYQPDIQTLKLLAEFFETSIDYLVGNTDVRHKIESVQPFDLNDDEAILIEKYRQLKTTARSSVMNMIDTLLE